MDHSRIHGLPEGRDLAWVFPGQGAQAVGMGRDLYDEIPAARAIFDAADQALGLPLSRICFEGPEKELTRTVNAQPALVTHAIAAVAAALDAGTVGERPAFVAGHSLGEYAALIVAGAVSFEDGVRLVRERGRLMQEACDARPSAMVAVLGLDADLVSDICDRVGASICNINGPGNIAVGGTVEAVDRASAGAAEAGAARIIPLTVAGAFHTPLMQSAADGMSEVLSSVSFRDPVIPVISNVTARPLQNGSELADELVRQVTHPVLWLDAMSTMQQAGVTRLVEFGPGRVLTGLARRLDRSLVLRNIGTVEEAQA